MPVNIRICVYKHPDIPHYEWETRLIEANDDYVLVYGEPERKFIHHTKQFTIYVKEPEILFFPLRDWYTVSIQKSKKDVMGYNYYCNICAPPKFINDTISFVDYDIDIINDGMGWQTVDSDEFTENSKKYAYPQEIIKTVYTKEEELKKTIKNSLFPFDGLLLAHAKRLL